MELHVCTQNGALLRAFYLGDSEEIIVGRESHCDIRITSRKVSREHCSIERDGEDMVLRDLGSTGGTLVRGKPVERVTVQDGLEVGVGPALLKFVDAGM